jgi:hypothetical protein
VNKLPSGVQTSLTNVAAKQRACWAAHAAAACAMTPLRAITRNQAREQRLIVSRRSRSRRLD